MKRFDLLIFDWDGTLYDSTGNIVRALRAACREFGLPEASEADARYVIGLELSRALRYVVPELPDDRLAPLAACYGRHYRAADKEMRPFDGIQELLAALHTSGFQLAVATGKSRKGLARAFVNSGLGVYFSGSRCADECLSKPHPQMLEELMDEFAVPADRTLMIGDTSHDMLMAANAGVAGLAVSYGAHSRADLVRAAPLACVDDVAQLALWLEQNA